MDKFAFIFHPLDEELVCLFETGLQGKSPRLIRKVLEWLPPFVGSKVTGCRSLTGREIEGYFIILPLLPDQMITADKEKVIGQIVQAGHLAEDLGAQIVGLGSLTAIIGRNGEEVAQRLTIPVTTGHSYAAATALESLFKAARIMDIEMSRANVAIVGATGSIGSVCARIMSGHVGDLKLIARNNKKLDDLAQIIARDQPRLNLDTALIDTPGMIEALARADLILAAASVKEPFLSADHFKSGAVICDVAMPKNLILDSLKSHNDILVIDGGLVKPPGNVQFHFNFGLPPGLAHPCVSETMILALEERFENYSLGHNLSPEKVREISQLGGKHGFSLTGLRSFNRPLPNNQIWQTKSNAWHHRLIYQD